LWIVGLIGWAHAGKDNAEGAMNSLHCC
jgi:hypothetical protein